MKFNGEIQDKRVTICGSKITQSDLDEVQWGSVFDHLRPKMTHGDPKMSVGDLIESSSANPLIIQMSLSSLATTQIY